MGNVICVEKELVKSKAFHKLTRKSSQVLFVLFTKRVFKKTKGKTSRTVLVNNGEIEFTYSEAKKYYDMSDGVFRRAVEQLAKYGFLEITSVGGLYKTANKFTLLDNWRDYGTNKFVAGKIPEKRYSGVGFQKGNRHGKNTKNPKLEVINNKVNNSYKAG